MKTKKISGPGKPQKSKISTGYQNSKKILKSLNFPRKEMRKIQKQVEKAEKEIKPIKEVEKTTKNIFEKIEEMVHPKKKRGRTLGQKAADFLTKWAGSWVFIIGFFIFLGLWIVINTAWIIFGRSWDPYPFILLNLALSCLAAIQAPIILMSQNRTNQRDRLRAEYDYQVNRKAEKEIQQIIRKLDDIEKRLK